MKISLEKNKNSWIADSMANTWAWLTIESLPLLIIVPALPALGIFICVSIAEWTWFNHKLSNHGERTKAQIMHKYEKGSRTYYKVDRGKSYFIICEFIIQNKRTDRFMLCQSKFMVAESVFKQYEAGEFLNMIYVPTKSL